MSRPPPSPRTRAASPPRALGRAVTLQRALVAVAKGFGGVGASEPDGTSILWLQVLRRPTLRLLAVVLAALSVYVLIAEAAAALLAAAPVLASSWRAPALALRAAAAARSPALAVALDFAVVCHLTACTYAALLSSALVAPLAIYPRKSSAPCLLRHSGWCVRLVLPLCSHYVATLVGGAADASAFSAALGTPWRPAQPRRRRRRRSRRAPPTPQRRRRSRITGCARSSSSASPPCRGGRLRRRRRGAARRVPGACASSTGARRRFVLDGRRGGGATRCAKG